LKRVAIDELGIERVQACTRWHFAFALCCHRNATRAMCTDCKSAHYCTTGGHLLPLPKLHPGLCSSVGMRPRTDTHTYRQTDRRTRMTTICFASFTTHAKYRLCPVSERLAKRLSKKKFLFIRINWKAPSGKFFLS